MIELVAVLAGVGIVGAVAWQVIQARVLSNEATRTANIVMSATDPIPDAPPPPLPPTVAAGSIAPTGPQPVGIRNNNPGNIRTRGTRNGIGGSDPWQGLIAEDNAGYAVFVTGAYGLRAIAKELATSFNRGQNTVASIIAEWAPPTENNTTSYIKSVASRTGFGQTTPILYNRNNVRALVLAIVWHENGQQPYDAATIETALNMAGL